MAARGEGRGRHFHPRGFLGESFFTARAPPPPPPRFIRLPRRTANKRKGREIFRRIAGVLGGISLISRSSSGKCRGGPRESLRATYRGSRRRERKVAGRASGYWFYKIPVKQCSLQLLLAQKSVL